MLVKKTLSGQKQKQLAKKHSDISHTFNAAIYNPIFAISFVYRCTVLVDIN